MDAARLLLRSGDQHLLSAMQLHVAAIDRRHRRDRQTDGHRTVTQMLAARNGQRVNSADTVSSTTTHRGVIVILYLKYFTTN